MTEKRKILQTKRFQKKLKKLFPSQKKEIDKVVKQILENPRIGEAKKGDLSGVYVYKFKISNTLYLIAYTFDEKSITLLMLGSRENFYRDLKKG